MTRALYLLGGPGSGKSTLMARLLVDWTPGPYVRLTPREMFGHYLLDSDLQMGIYLGHLRPEYPGTDALSLSAAPHALGWLESLDPHLSWVFGEGIRLGHPGFLEALSHHTDLLVVHLKVDPEVSVQRRANRPGKTLSSQYCKTATTRSANAISWCREVGISALELDGSRSVEELAEDISCFQ